MADIFQSPVHTLSGDSQYTFNQETRQVQPGTRLGPYEVIAPIGAGGMGEVYRARDVRLDRDVAIKVLPAEFASDPDRLWRFEQEAHAVAALDHPNILALYDVGTYNSAPYIVTQLLEGESLRDRLNAGGLTVRKAVEAAVQIAQGLAAAHEKGIIHRDLKPENVFVTKDGRVKLLDFGIAKLTAPKSVEDPVKQTTVVEATEVGTVLGTVGYMSPEQVRGQSVDRRTDIFSFGCVLYEMLSGRSPFRRETAADTASAILLEDPAPLAGIGREIPAALVRIVARCLEKRPEDRFESARDLGFALHAEAEAHAGPSVTRFAAWPRRRLWAGVAAIGVAAVGAVALYMFAVRNHAGAPTAAGLIRSIAVLPLENLSGDPGQEYFADGMTEALINTLAQIGALSVISRTTVMQFKGTHMLLPEIAKRLNYVDAVIEGSVQRSGKHVKVSVQLVSAATDTPLWAKDYDRELSDVLALQGEVARAIAEQVRVELTPGERRRLAAARSVDPEAYDLFLRGRAHSRRENREDNDEAIALLERAVAADPSFAAVHAELARAYGIRHFFFAPDDAELEKKARLEVETALRLDPESSDAHLARGVLLWDASYHFPHAEAIRGLRRAIELNPSSDEAHHQLSLVYSHVGLLDQALREVQEAIRLNPDNALAPYRLGCVRLYMRDYKGAWDLFSKIPLDSNPALLNYVDAWTLFDLGRKDEARARTDEYEHTYPRDVGGLNASMQAILAADAGDAVGAEVKIRAAVEHGKGYRHFHHTEYNVATAYALLGKPSQALQWLQAAADDGLPCYPLFQSDPNLDRIRRDVRFVAFLAKQKQQWEAFRRL